MLADTESCAPEDLLPKVKSISLENGSFCTPLEGRERMEAPVTLSCAWALLVPQELCSYRDLISMGTIPTLGALTPVSFIHSISPKHKESNQAII